MLTEQRQIYIMHQLQEKSFITVKDLIQQLHASRSSVVRDLNALEEKGLLVRQHGGASLKAMADTLNALTEKSVMEKECVQVDAKQRICEQAAKLIQDGDCIYIDSGTTPTYLLPYIVDKKVSLVTTSIYLIRKLSKRFKGEIFLIGGQYDMRYDMSYGATTQQMIQQFHFDRSFFSTNGMDLNNGEVMIADFNLGGVKQDIQRRTRQNILLMDASKFHQIAVCTWAHMRDFDQIYVDVYNEKQERPDHMVVCETGGKR